MTTMSRKRTRSYSEDHKLSETAESFKREAARKMVSAYQLCIYNSLVITR